MKNFQFSIFNFQKLIIILAVILLGLFIPKTANAETAIDKGINFLKSKQDSSGRITTGFSAPSQWSAIAFTANGIDAATVKNPTVSLKDFLLSDVPGDSSSATDWEPRILAIVAIGENPTNFGGTNFVAHLESFYNNNQIGDMCSLNDDIFGVLAFTAAGTTANTQIKQESLNFLISKQDSTDGGFGFSAPGCDYYSTSADMTSAAIQALIYAKQNGLTNSGLDDAITKAKNYLIANQNSDGGFGYYGSSDTDTTGWALMAFNALGMNDSVQVTGARNWLVSQQSATDGGIMAYDYGANASVSNASTTAQAMIALSGKTWILKIFTVSENTGITPTPTVSPTPTPSPSPTATPTPTPAPPASPTPTPTPVTVNNYLTSYYPQYTTSKSDPVITNITRYLPDPGTNKPAPASKPTSPSPATEVLGDSVDKSKTNTNRNELIVQGISSASWPLAFVIGLYIVVKSFERRLKR